MKCPQCHVEIPDRVEVHGRKIRLPLLCPDCVERQSRQAYLEHQKQYLPGVLEGVYALTLTKHANGLHWHVVLVGDAHHAWCGSDVSTRWARRYVKFPEQRLADVCRECHATFDRLVKELGLEVA